MSFSSTLPPGRVLFTPCSVATNTPGVPPPCVPLFALAPPWFFFFFLPFFFFPPALDFAPRQGTSRGRSGCGPRRANRNSIGFHEPSRREPTSANS